MSYLTDQEIIGAVTSALARDGRVNLADVIHVAAENGVVRLAGTVQSAGQKQSAEDVARHVHGIVGVENDLTVAVEGEISDTELRDAVLAALTRSRELAPRVGCRVDDGIVTLVGHIQDAAQEEEAIRIAGAVKGVEQVVSTLEIAEIVPDETVLPIDDATLLDKLSETLDKAGIDIRDRDLHVDRGVASLRGKVGTEKERQWTEAVAASVDGIRAVHNHLVLWLSEESADRDEALAARVVHALTRDGRVSPRAVHVVAREGLVVATGQVDSIEDQNAVTEVIRAVPDVRRVENEVVLMDRTSARSGDKGVHARPRSSRRS